MIKSLLDTDLYKLSMGQFAFHQFPHANVKYEFKCRTKGIDFKPHLKRIEKEIESFRQLRFTAEEIGYLQSLPYMKQDFLDYLFGYRNDNNRYEIYIDKNNDLNINIYGQWINTILAEVPVLAIVNEVYFTNGMTEERLDTHFKIGREKITKSIESIKKHNMLNGDTFKFMEFGTRRRFSMEWQREVVKMLMDQVPESLLGTSNVLLAKDLGLKPLGTMAHELLMLHQAVVRVEDSQKMALQNWAEEYRGQLAIALSDTLGIDAFLKDFDLYFAKLYDGVRQDSGDPIDIYNKVVAHYEKLGIDPKTKTIIFSDGLTLDSAVGLLKQTTKMKAVFGIGTSLSNNVGVEPLQIVMKLTECNGKPVAKISEARGKTMCNDPIYLEYLKRVFDIK